MTRHLGAPPIGGGEGCSLRLAADWLRGEAARRPPKLSKHLLLPARIPIVAATSGPTLRGPGSWEAAGTGQRPAGRGEEVRGAPPPGCAGMGGSPRDGVRPRAQAELCAPLRRRAGGPPAGCPAAAARWGWGSED